MSSRNSVAGFALFTFVFAVISSLAGAQTLAPAPAPTSDDSANIDRSRDCVFANGGGFSVDLPNPST
ncbi:unnamed protein product [Arabis nemorensis]|uniref:Uncharacterized protein n=1 Tax=Arabis nemorensis TaxID=586526 RepID=A0A565CJV7_9BRAS|nr:unnamed protein product [Arabis nemorensis]